MDWSARFHEDWEAAKEMQAALKAEDHDRIRALMLKRGGIDMDADESSAPDS
jgi:hypothetical protein